MSNWKSRMKGKPQLFTAEGTPMRILQEEYQMPEGYTGKLFDNGVVDIYDESNKIKGSLTKEKFDEMMGKVKALKPVEPITDAEIVEKISHAVEELKEPSK